MHRGRSPHCIQAVWIILPFHDDSYFKALSHLTQSRDPCCLALPVHKAVPCGLILGLTPRPTVSQLTSASASGTSGATIRTAGTSAPTMRSCLTPSWQHAAPQRAWARGPPLPLLLLLLLESAASHPPMQCIWRTAAAWSCLASWLLGVPAGQSRRWAVTPAGVQATRRWIACCASGRMNWSTTTIASRLWKLLRPLSHATIRVPEVDLNHGISVWPQLFERRPHCPWRGPGGRWRDCQLQCRGWTTVLRTCDVMNLNHYEYDVVIILFKHRSSL
jgi:hypothetical protein